MNPVQSCSKPANKDSRIVHARSCSTWSCSISFVEVAKIRNVPTSYFVKRGHHRDFFGSFENRTCTELTLDLGYNREHLFYLLKWNLLPIAPCRKSKWRRTRTWSRNFVSRASTMQECIISSKKAHSLKVSILCPVRFTRSCKSILTRVFLEAACDFEGMKLFTSNKRHLVLVKRNYNAVSLDLVSIGTQLWSTWNLTLFSTHWYNNT